MRGLSTRAVGLWRTHALLRHLAIAAIALVVVIAVLTAADEFQSTRLAEMAYIATAAGGLTLLTGLNGQISLGHGALMAFGAYTAALMLNDRDSSTPLFLVVLVAVGITVIVGLVIGAAAARLRGPYLAGATLTLAVAVPDLAKQFKSQLGGDEDVRAFVPDIPRWATNIAYYLTGSDPEPRKYVAFLAWVTLIVTFVLLANLASSRVGRRWAAVRDDEVAAELAGINLTWARVSAFTVSAAAAGASGAMFTLAQRTAAPGGFNLELSLKLLAIVVLGGLGSLTGAIVLAGVITYLPSVVMGLGSGFDATRASQFATLSFGLVMVLVILLAPRGLAGVGHGLTQRVRARRSPPDEPNDRSSGLTPDGTTHSSTDSSTDSSTERTTLRKEAP